MKLKGLPNKGREADTYLNYIIDNYENLADKNIFAQGDPFHHSPDFLELLSKTEMFKPIQCLTDRYLQDIMPPQNILEKYKSDYIENLATCAYPMCFTNFETIWFHVEGSLNIAQDLREFYNIPNGDNLIEFVLTKCGFVFEKEYPLIGSFSYGAMFAASKERILSHRIECYKALRHMNLNGCRLFASVMERVWLYLFGHQ